jgi:hypothetical protein
LEEKEPEPSITSEDNSSNEEADNINGVTHPEVIIPEYLSEHLIIKRQKYKIFLGPDEPRKILS